MLEHFQLVVPEGQKPPPPTSKEGIQAVTWGGPDTATLAVTARKDLSDEDNEDLADFPVALLEHPSLKPLTVVHSTLTHEGQVIRALALSPDARSVALLADDGESPHEADGGECCAGVITISDLDKRGSEAVCAFEPHCCLGSSSYGSVCPSPVVGA